MRKGWWLLGLFVILIGFSVWLMTAVARQNQVVSPLSSDATTLAVASPTPPASPFVRVSEPVKLIIPKIGVEAVVEQVGLDQEQRMDVPKDFTNVAWYRLGARLGEMGSAVIAGHFDTPTGEPSVFYRIEELQPGDEIQVDGEDGFRYVYIVESVAEYPDANFPLNEVFARTDARRLNLITCSGSFDPNSQNYSHRVVAFAKLQE